MYHSVQFCRLGLVLVKNFRYNFLENRTMYFVENYMIVKLQCCTIWCNIFFSQIINFHFVHLMLVMKLLPALPLYMLFGLQVISGFQ